MANISSQRISFLLTHPRSLWASIVYHTPQLWSDKYYLQVQFRSQMGYKLNLIDPESFSEKLQWLKLYNRLPEYTTMVDKVKVKDYVSSILGNEYVIPTLGVWEDPDEIDFEILPQRFVLKCNHNSGMGMYICKDKAKMNVEEVKAELRKGLKQNYYLTNREWPYKNVPRRILAEQYIDPAPNVQDLPDFKWYCFNGEPKYCQVIQGRNSHETIDFFDTDWNHQEFVGLSPEAGNAAVMPKRPANLEMHMKIARELSKGIPFSQIDVYETGEKIYYAEVTLYSTSGLGEFLPNKYNEIFGQMTSLSGEKREGLIITVSQDNSFSIDKPDLKDYKWFCFDGEVKALFIATDRSKGEHATRFDFFDEDFRHLPFTNGHPNAAVLPEKPKLFEQMKALAIKLSKGIPHVRIDFYEVNNRIYFGEMTFFHWSGLMPYNPIDWDYKFGEWLQLPDKKV